VLSITDVLVKTIASNLTDSVSITDAIVALKIILLNLASTLVIADTTTKSVGVSQEDALAISETTQRTWDAIRAITDSIGLTDTISKKPIIPLTDLITILESKVTASGKLFTEGVDVVDVKTALFTKVRTDSITITDSTFRDMGRILSMLFINAMTALHQLAIAATGLFMFSEVMTLYIISISIRTPLSITIKVGVPNG
jgi:hypothetical protein